MFVRSIAPIAALGCLVASSSASHAAKIVVPFSVPIVLTAPSTTSTYDFTVPGFDPSKGTLSGVNINYGIGYGTSTIEYDVKNTGTTTVSGSGAYSEGSSSKLVRPDTGVTLFNGGSSSGSATFGFSLAPGQTTTVRLQGTGGSVGSSVSSSLRSYFSRAGDLPLAVVATGETFTVASGLTVLGQRGQINTSAGGTIEYTYASNNTTPPADAQRIALSSTTDRALTAGGVLWYVFDYAGGAFSIDTLGSALSSTDTQIGLFSSTGAVVKLNDDISGANYLSKISYANGALAAGTYYLAVTGYNGFSQSAYFGKGFDVSTANSTTGTVRVNLTQLPEPATIAVFAAIGFAACRRPRRR